MYLGNRRIKIDFLRKNIRSWFREHGRDYPWRKKSLTEYEIAVSEVLLQRTRADTVLHYYPVFLGIFPTWAALSRADKQTLQRILQPMGLSNHRASALLGLSQRIAEQGGKMPSTRKELENLPGIGQYIAGAILAICYGAREPLLDSNMARLMERYFGLRRHPDIRHDSTLQQLSKEMLPKRNIKEFNWAVLDFAALVCKPRKPECTNCILGGRCSYAMVEQNSSRT